MIKVHAVSGLGGKSAACFLIETRTARLLLDLGEGPSVGQFPDVSDVGPVDAILISHGHNDHIGGLHLAERLGEPPIYATAMTQAFAGHPRLSQALPLPLKGKVEIAGVEVETGRAGHAAGGVWMRIGGEHGVLYTGDLCRESLLYPVDTPLPAQTLIADASYGVYDEGLSAAVRRLAEVARSGPLLLPLPPTGRGVEIAVLLHEAGIPISLCAQHQRIAALMLDAEIGTLYPQGRERLANALAQARPLDMDSPPLGAMLAANGGATGGVSKALLERFIDSGDASVLFTGHVEAGTLAKAAIEAGQAGFLRWNVHPLASDIVWLHEVVRPKITHYAFCSASVSEGLRLHVARAIGAAVR